MSCKLIKATVDIEQCPVVCPIESSLEVTLGDLHANAIKLLYALVRHGVLVISDEQYAELVRIYKTPILSLNSDFIKRYDEIIDSLPVANKEMLIRLIGDEVGDRGMNDYFVLKLIEKLRTEAVPCRILASNHGMGFLKKYQAFKETRTMPLPAVSACAFEYSSVGLNYLLEQKIISEDRLIQLVEEQYNPTLKLLDYNISDNGKTITIFSHACIDVLVIYYAAKQLNVAFDDSNTFKLAATIDAINDAFNEYVKAGTAASLLNDSSIKNHARIGGQSPIHAGNAVDYIVWNRDHGVLNRSVSRRNKDYLVHYVHGHDRVKSHLKNVITLDNLLGKSAETHVGIYNVLVRVAVSFDLAKLMEQIGHWIKQGFGLSELSPVVDNYLPENRESARQSIGLWEPSVDENISSDKDVCDDKTAEVNSDEERDCECEPAPSVLASAYPGSFWRSSDAAASSSSSVCHPADYSGFSYASEFDEVQEASSSSSGHTRLHAGQVPSAEPQIPNILDPDSSWSSVDMPTQESMSEAYSNDDVSDPIDDLLRDVFNIHS